MKIFKPIQYISILIILCSVPWITNSAAQTGAVQVGEPLHIYLRRQPVQDMTYLYFHPPDGTYQEKAMDNLSYRKTLFSKGSGSDSERMFFPQDPASNFLQFEPNETISLTYNFTISAVRPIDLTDTTYILQVLIDVDYNNDKDYDYQIIFEISGEANSEREVKKGTVSINMDRLKKFDAKNGGRLRVNISRKDDLQTSVTIYCGYQGLNSYFVLPFSKYKYETSENGNSYNVLPWILLVGGVVIIAGVGYFYLKQKQVDKAPKPEERKRGARRRR
jgi:hypothetical protein